MITSSDGILASQAAGKKCRTDFMKLTNVACTAGRYYDLSLAAGHPVQNLYAGTNLTFVPLSDTDGKGIWHGGNVSTDIKHILNLGVNSTVATALGSNFDLVDVLGYYPLTTNTITTAQTLINTLSLPRFTDGAGVRAYIVATSTMGAGTPSITMTYTNQAGVAGRTMPVTVSTVSAAVQGTIVHSDPSANKYFPFLPLASGDTGIRSIQTITLSATMTSGSMALVLCKPKEVKAPLTLAGSYGMVNTVSQIPAFPRVYDGENLNILYYPSQATVTATPMIGFLETVWG